MNTFPYRYETTAAGYNNRGALLSPPLSILSTFLPLILSTTLHLPLEKNARTYYLIMCKTCERSLSNLLCLNCHFLFAITYVFQTHLIVELRLALSPYLFVAHSIPIASPYYIFCSPITTSMFSASINTKKLPSPIPHYAPPSNLIPTQFHSYSTLHLVLSQNFTIHFALLSYI